MPLESGSRYFAKLLDAYGVTHVFFMPTIMMPAMAAMEDYGVEHITTHGEAAAVYMADGYARARGGVGICLAQNVGSGNVAAALREARLAGSPVIAITGGNDPKSRYRNVYQEIDDFPMLVPVTKWGAHVEHVERLPDVMRQAFRVATTGAPGPVHVRMQGRHGNVVNEDAVLELVPEVQFGRVPAFRPRADLGEIQAAVAALRAATRPLLIAGGGVTMSGAGEQVQELARRLGIPVATSLNGKGTIPEDQALSVGLVGTYSRSCAQRAAAEADVVFFIGSRTGMQVTHHWRLLRPDTRVIQLDINPEEIGRNYPGAIGVLADARAGLEQMIEALPGEGHSATEPWLERVATLKDEWQAQYHGRMNDDSVPLRPERVCAELSDLLPPDVLLVADTGHSAVWTGTMVELRHPGQRYIRCAGTLGWAFPASLGAQCATPDTPVVCFTGDGGFYYHLSELETAVRHEIGVTVIVNNNHALNQEQRLINEAYGGQQHGKARQLWVYEEINFARVAENFGCRGIRVEQPGDLAAAMKTALESAGPTVIDVVTDIDALHDRAWVREGADA